MIQEHKYAIIPFTAWQEATENYEVVTDYFESEDEETPSYKLIEDANMTTAKCHEISSLGGQVFTSSQELLDFLHNHIY